jgi:hypothetical protein
VNFDQLDVVALDFKHPQQPLLQRVLKRLNAHMKDSIVIVGAAMMQESFICEHNGACSN